MTTNITIPYVDNKGSSILQLLSFLHSAGHLKFDDIGARLHEFHDGKDLNFDIPDSDLPGVLRQISGNGFIYKPEHLKIRQTDHGRTIHNYRHIVHQNYTADITVFLNGTKNDNCSVTVSDRSLATDQKAILIAAIEKVLLAVPEKESSWDIDVKKVSSSVSLTPDILEHIGQQWTLDYFKAGPGSGQ